MSRSYSANQYQNAFVPNKLQNWEVAMKHRENNWKNLQHNKALYDQHPSARSGQTVIIGTDRGHLLEGVARSDQNPWGNFVGTWDLPNKVPGNKARIPTARSVHAADSLARHSHHATNIITGVKKNEDRQQIRAQGRQEVPNAPGSHHLPPPGTPPAAAPATPQRVTPQRVTPQRVTPPASATKGAAPVAASPAGAAMRYPEPEVPCSPSDSPVGLPSGQRSPTPPQRSPIPNRTGEQVPVAL